MYIVDFFKRMGRKANIPVIIYLVLNVVLITMFITTWGLVWWEALLLGLALYLVSVAISLSPLGEWILRRQSGCEKIKDPEVEQRLQPLFQEVYARAKELDPSIPDGVTLYISDDESPNAFATGRKTICVTKGLLELPPNMIKATLAHEFGHLAHKDTDLILVVSVGNMFISGIILFIDICLKIGYFFMQLASALVGGEAGCLMNVANAVTMWLSTLLVSGLTWLWTKLGTLLVMSSSRSNEYEADAFAYQLGYGNDLCALLDTICDATTAKGLFANLASSHPGKEKRIDKLCQLGAVYHP